MKSLFKKQPDKSEKHAITELLEKIQNGDRHARNAFIERYDPFILSVTSKVRGEYVDKHNDHEYSIALEAFDKAIQLYDANKGSAFFPFAKLIIRQELIDYYRKTLKNKDIPFSVLEKEDPDFLKHYPSKEEMGENFFLKNEIAIFRSMLEEYGIRFESLVQESPKHQDTRQGIFRLVYKMINDPGIREEVFRSGRLPLKKIEPMAEIKRKALEKHRKYILATFLLLTSELETMKNYFAEVQE